MRCMENCCETAVEGCLSQNCAFLAWPTDRKDDVVCFCVCIVG